MKFANPQFLWALFALALPIIIHLFRFRRHKTVYFTNVRFLRELRQETQSRSRLRHLLILISRCLALAALVLAFAQPYIPATSKAASGDRVISIYIDNSFSMDAQGESSSLLELARKHALDISQSYKPSDRFQLITNDFESRHQRLLTSSQFINMLEEVKPSPVSRKASEVLRRQSDLLKRSGAPNKIVYHISDFQKEAADYGNTDADSSLIFHCLHLQPALTDNVGIDSCWFESPFREKGKPDILKTQITNYASRRIENIPLKLSIDSVQRGLENISLGPDSSLTAAVTFTTPVSGIHSGELRITDYPVTFDDVLYFSYNVPDKIRIMSLNGGESSPFLNQLYEKNQAFEFKNVSARQVDYSQLASQQLIILNEIESVSSGLTQELQKFTSNGGSVLVFPAKNPDIAAWESFSSALKTGVYSAPKVQAQKVGSLNDKHRIYDDVFEKRPDNIDLPSVNRYVPFRAAGSSREEYIMRMQNGDLFLAGYDAGKGSVYLCAVALAESESNFPRHSLFIPTLYKIALYSAPMSRLFYVIGRQEPIELTNVQLSGDQSLKIRSRDRDFEIIPEHRVNEGRVQVFVRDQITEAGNYYILQGNDVIAAISYNYDRSESKRERFIRDELSEILENSGWNNARVIDGAVSEIRPAIAQLDEGRPLWKLFIILALLFFAVEILLIRLLK